MSAFTLRLDDDRVDEVQDACWAAMAAELDRLGIPRHEIGRWDEMQDAIRAYLKIMVTQAATTR